MKFIHAAAALSVAALAVAAMAVAGPAAAQPRQAPARAECLRTNQIDSFSPIPGDLRSMVVIDKFRNKYKLSFNSVCEDIDYNGAVQIRTNSNFALSCIARGDRVISQSVSGWRDRCVITRVERYTPEMQRADALRTRRDSYRR